MGIIKKSGVSYSYTPEGGPEEKLGRGYDATRTYLRENKKLGETILKQIRKRLTEDESALKSKGAEQADKEEEEEPTE